MYDIGDKIVYPMHAPESSSPSRKGNSGREKELLHYENARWGNESYDSH